MEEERDPDVSWVAQLAAVRPSAAEKAVREAVGERRLFHHLARQHRQEGRSSYIEIDAPLELYALVRLMRPAQVVEVGVSSGVSSAYLLQALEENRRGTLHSVDLPKLPPAGARRGGVSPASWSLPPGRQSGWAVPFPLRRRWDLRLGNKKDVLPLFVEELSGIDLFLYDVPHEDVGTWAEFRSLTPLLHRGSVAIADHGPNGGRCPALAKWAAHNRSHAVRRAGLGLYGFRSG